LAPAGPHFHHEKLTLAARPSRKGPCHLWVRLRGMGGHAEPSGSQGMGEPPQNRLRSSGETLLLRQHPTLGGRCSQAARHPGVLSSPQPRIPIWAFFSPKALLGGSWRSVSPAAHRLSWLLREGRGTCRQQPRVAGEPGAEPRGAPKTQQPWRDVGSQAGPCTPRHDPNPLSLHASGEDISPRQPAPPDSSPCRG